jgi:hypothetical protein
MVAGASAYYFAKKDINTHRREQELRGVRGTEFLECVSPWTAKTNSQGGKLLIVEKLESRLENRRRQERRKRRKIE